MLVYPFVLPDLKPSVNRSSITAMHRHDVPTHTIRKLLRWRKSVIYRAIRLLKDLETMEDHSNLERRRIMITPSIIKENIIDFLLSVYSIKLE